MVDVLVAVIVAVLVAVAVLVVVLSSAKPTDYFLTSVAFGFFFVRAAFVRPLWDL